MYFLGALTNSPKTLTYYAGVFRGVLGAGEEICFGPDSIPIPFIEEAGGLFAFYGVGILVFYYLCLIHINETNYFKDGEDGVIVPNHVLAERGLQGEQIVSEGEEERARWIRRKGVLFRKIIEMRNVVGSWVFPCLKRD